MMIAIVRAGLVRVGLIAEGESALVDGGTFPSCHGAQGFESSLDAARARSVFVGCIVVASITSTRSVSGLIRTTPRDASSPRA